MSEFCSKSGMRFLPALFMLLMIMSACAAPPREVTTEQPSPASSPAGSDSSSTIAVGHGSTAPQTATVPMSGGGSGSSAVKWKAPVRWRSGPEKPMRAATYFIPAAPGDPEGAECAVFVDIGGGVDANIDRWIGQFEQPDGSASSSKAKRSSETINGLQVTTVDLTGTFAGGGMAMGQPSTKKPGFRLLGAIIEGPRGEVFFKLTGPAKTVAAAQTEFRDLLKSIEK